MTWLAWRQLRVQVVLLVGALILIVLALVSTRGHVGVAYGPTGSRDLTGVYVWVRLLGTVLIGVPVGIGVFWGAPMIAGEIEARTHRLAWTQSITRDRWLATKVGLTGAIAVGVVAVFALTFTWWALPIDATGSRISPANFAQRGIVPMGYAVFAIGLGVLLGAVTRRTLPAMAATIVGFIVVRVAVQKVVRQHLVSATVVRTDPFGDGPRGGWALTTRTVDAAGRSAGSDFESHLVKACHITRATPDPNGALAACAHTLGFRNVTRVVPGSSFWQLQAIEFAIFVLLAAALVAATFWWMRRRIV